MTNNKRKGIACGGVWIVDTVKVVDCYPAENSLTNISSESIGGGGCAHNAIINLAKFDQTLELYALGVVGCDPNGDFLINQCLQFPNINTNQIVQTNLARTSYTDVFSIRNKGGRTFFHYRGANRLFGPEYVDLDALPVEILHLGYLLLLDTMDQLDQDFGTTAARFLASVQEHGIKTSIDLVSEDSRRFTQIVPPALRHTDYCIINDFEAERLSGISIREQGKPICKNLKRMAAAIFDMGVKELVVVHFPEGAYLLTNDRIEVIQPSLALPDDYIVGSTGAGDSFCAGVLYGTHSGWSYEKILRFAVCAGGMVSAA